MYFPLATNAPAATFGSADAGVRIWAWDAHRGKGRRLDGSGPGVFRPALGDVARGDLGVYAERRDDGWDLVLSGPLAEAADRIGVAIWAGANDERAGIGATTHEWLPLEIG